MLNKKRVLAMAMTSAMIASALAGCSGSTDSTTTTAAATTAAAETTTAAASEETTAADTADETTEAPTEADTTIAPDYDTEAGKVVDFEDGNYGFVMVDAGALTKDNATLEVVDFNGSKALKVTPSSTVSGKDVEIGFDVTSLLGDKVADVASVKMQIGVSAADGEFYACAGNVYMSYSSMASADGSYSVYVDYKNPMTVSAAFASGVSYDASAKNVMVVTKATDSGSNMDVAFSKTGEYSTLYIDNIVFFDADGNAIDVDTTGTFETPDGFGSMDWSNLIDVSATQVVIDGWSEGETNGWAQGTWHQNKCVVTENVEQTDEDGNIIYKQKTDKDTGELVYDDDGNPVYTKNPEYVQATDEDGNPVVDENGDPVYETRDVEQGDFDFGAIMKPGTVFTLYYTAEASEDLNHYIWFVFTTGDADLLAANGSLGWARICDAPDAANAGLTLDSSAEDKAKYLFTLNDSQTMAQVTYDQIVDFMTATYEGFDVNTFDWNGLNFSLQVEAGMKWTLSAVTYATDAY